MSTVETDIDRPTVIPETLRTKSYRYAVQDWAACNALSHLSATGRDEAHHNQQELSVATGRGETNHNQQELSAESLNNQQQVSI